MENTENITMSEEAQPQTKKRKGFRKTRLLIYLVVIIVLLFLGFTLYYFIRNNEEYTYTLERGDSIHINMGDSYKLPVQVKKKNSHTAISVKIISYSGEDASSILTYNPQTDMLVASGSEGGTVNVVISSTNEKFQNFNFDVWVGDGSDENYWSITKKEEFLSIGKEGSKFKIYDSYSLNAAIDFNGEEITPIQNFSGRFIGNKNILKNFKITATQNNAGLFANLTEKAVVKQIIAIDGKVEGEFANAGVIAGECDGTISTCQIQNCKVGSTQAGANVGAVCGLLKRGEANIRSYVILCKNINTQIISTSCSGGIVGKSIGGNIIDCQSSAVISAKDFAGGIVGYSAFAGNKRYTITKNCVSTSTFEGDVGVKDGICAKTESGTAYVGAAVQFIGCYANYTCPVSGANIVETDKLNVKTNFSSLDFKTNWSTAEDKQPVSLNLFEGEEQPIELYEYGQNISSANDLKTVLSNLSNNEGDSRSLSYNISSDITVDMTDTTLKSIGSFEKPFSGTLKVADGKKVTINNLTVDCAGFKFAGFFGCTMGQDCYINAFTLNNVKFINTNDAQYFGGFVGYCSGGYIIDCNITYAEELALETSVVGGFAGLNKGAIHGCTVLASFKRNNIASNLTYGGFCAENECVISACAVLTGTSVEVSCDGALVAGGIVGINIGKLEDSFVSCQFLATSKSDIIAGLMCGKNSGEIENCSSNISTLECYSESNYSVGGAVGYLGSGSTLLNCGIKEGRVLADDVGGIAGRCYGKIVECYSSSELSGKNVACLVFAFGGTIENSYSTNVVYSTVNLSGLFHQTANGSRVSKCYIGAQIAEFGGKEIYIQSIDNQYQFNKFFSVSKLDYEFNVYNEATFKYDTKIWKYSFFDFLRHSPEKTYSTNGETVSQNDIDLFVNTLKFDTTIWGLEIGLNSPVLLRTEYSQIINGTEMIVTQYPVE